MITLVARELADALGIGEVATCHRMDAEIIADSVNAVVPEWERRNRLGLSTEGSVGARREFTYMICWKVKWRT